MKTLPNSDCKACAIGEPFMNADPAPFEGSDPLKCAEWNAQGHHHIVWNGYENELVECGSQRCNDLGRAAEKRRAVERGMI